jgi:hypothetical protein
MRWRSYNFSTWVILSEAKGLAKGSLTTLGKQREASSVGQVPLPRLRDRHDRRSARADVLFITCR